MRLAIAIGNTNIKLGYMQNDALVTYSYAKEEFGANSLGKLSNTNTFTSMAIGSVVPQLNDTVANIVQTHTGTAPTIVEQAHVPINTTGYDTTLVGMDRLLNCHGALAKYGAPSIVFDLGTAISISVLDNNAVFVGGAILPGVQMGLDALSKGTALLPKLDTFQDHNPVVGSNTAACLTSGAIYGTASIIDGMAKKIQAELGYTCNLLLTGGFASRILPYLDTKPAHHPHLILEGLLALDIRP